MGKAKEGLVSGHASSSGSTPSYTIESPRKFVTGAFCVAISVLLFVPPYVLTYQPWDQFVSSFEQTDCLLLDVGIEECKGMKNFECQVQPFHKPNYACCRGWIKVMYNITDVDGAPQYVAAKAYDSPTEEYTDKATAEAFVESYQPSTEEFPTNNVNGSFPCFFDPLDKTRVVLHAQVFPRPVTANLAMWTIFGIIFFVFGCVLVCWSVLDLRKLKAHKRRTTGAGASLKRGGDRRDVGGTGGGKGFFGFGGKKYANVDAPSSSGPVGGSARNVTAIDTSAVAASRSSSSGQPLKTPRGKKARPFEP